MRVCLRVCACMIDLIFTRIVCARSVLRNMKSTEQTFKPAWREISLAASLGSKTTVQQSTGIKRISSLRMLPTARDRFHTLFAQDPMHDFAEGCIVWFLQRVLQEMCKSESDLVTFRQKLDEVRKIVSVTLRFPSLSEAEAAGKSWHLNGTFSRSFNSLLSI